jgi:myo-inositol 2-dehydrogenase/D-chiro-inositol 1-dehydrogenase
VLYDADPARAAAVAEETGAAGMASDPLALVGDPKVDAVLIASPDATHKELTLACIAARKPVLCEKPLAPTAAECLEVIAAETAAGARLVHVGYMRRFDPAYAEMKARLRSGALGNALMLHCAHRNVSAPSWFDSKMAIGNSAVHEFDIARWLLDSELTGIQVFRPKAASSASPGAPVFMVLETAGGQLVDIEIFIDAAYGYDVRGEMVCEKGTISLRSPVHVETAADRSQGIDFPADWRPRFADAYRLQAQAWIRGIATGKPAAGASAWDGHAAAAVAEAGLQSLAGQRPVGIQLAEKPELYD